MEFIFECLGDEFQGTGCTSMNINSTHSVNYTKKNEIENIITLAVTAYNDVHKMVGKKIIKFVNDKLKISPAKRLEHIPVEKLESAYLLSKDAIIKEISEDYENKYQSILDKINKLQAFYYQDKKQIE